MGICVRLNHGHYFENMKAIQDELSPIVIKFAPQVCILSTTKKTNDGNNTGAIPFLAVGDSIGYRNVIAEGHLTHGGAFCIEEVEDDEEEDDEDEKDGENRGVNKSD